MEEEAQYNAWLEDQQRLQYEEEEQRQSMWRESEAFEALGMKLVLSNGEPTCHNDGWRMLPNGQYQKVDSDEQYMEINGKFYNEQGVECDCDTCKKRDLWANDPVDLPF